MLKGGENILESIRQDLEWTKRNILSLERNNNLMFVISTSFIIILLSAFLLTWFGIIDLQYITNIKFIAPIEYIGGFIMFMINIYFMFSIALDFHNKTNYACLAYVIVYPLSTLLFKNSLITTVIIPILYLVIFNLFYCKINWKRFFSYSIFINITICILTLFLNYIKNHYSAFKYYEFENCLSSFIYSIDLYLCYIVLYKGVKNYGAYQTLVWRTKFFSSFRAEMLNIGIEEDTADLTIRQRRIFFLLVWSYLIMQSFLIIGINVLMNQILYYMGSFYIGVIELIIMWIVLEFSRLALGRTYHNKNPIICNAISLGVFFLMSRLAIPLRYSLFFNICIAAAIAVIIHILVIRNDEYKELFIFKERITKFNLKTCTKDELIERCRLKGLSKEDTELCVSLFIDRLRIYDLAEKYYISEQSMKNKKYKLSKLLNSTF